MWCTSGRPGGASRGNVQLGGSVRHVGTYGRTGFLQQLWLESGISQYSTVYTSSAFARVVSSLHDVHLRRREGVTPMCMASEFVNMIPLNVFNLDMCLRVSMGESQPLHAQKIPRSF